MSAIRSYQFFGLLSLLLPIQAVAAADWRTVFSARNEIIEIDANSVARGSGRATAWSRVRLDRDVIDGGGRYDAIHARNIYDCENKRFTTLGRAYYHRASLVREESVARHRANAVLPGSLDERLFNVACRDLNQVGTATQGDTAGRRETIAQVEESSGRPAPMHADMRVAADDGGLPKVYAVADAATTEKQKLIVLPAIDKAAAASAAAPREGSGQSAGSAPPAAAKAAAAATAAIGPVRPESRGSAGAEVESADDRRRRELHYATSGPRKAVRKKSSAEAFASGDRGNPAAALHDHWTYEGETGPANWARLKSDYASCAAGKRQSPIDIRDGIKVNLEAIKFDYKPTRFRIVDNGHTVQVNVGEGSGLNVMGKRYELLQFHFHKPSEERVNGRSYDMSIHLVHRNDEGQLAVVAVLLEKGSEHPLIQILLNHLPLEQDVEVTPEEAIEPAKLLPENRAYWTYMGSLTTPPCSEGVLWMVLKHPLQVAADQVAIFARVLRNNARPVQASNGRLIKETR